MTRINAYRDARQTIDPLILCLAYPLEVSRRNRSACWAHHRRRPIPTTIRRLRGDAFRPRQTSAPALTASAIGAGLDDGAIGARPDDGAAGASPVGELAARRKPPASQRKPAWVAAVRGSPTEVTAPGPRPSALSE